MTASPLTPASVLPAASTELWAPAAVFSADWGAKVLVRSAFTTDTALALGANEQRRSLMSRPVRSVAATLRGDGAAGVAALRALAMRSGRARSLFPLYADQTRTTAATAALATTLACDTRWRRIHAGARVAVAAVADGLRAARFEVRTLLAVAEASVDLDAPLAEAYPAGSLVLPLIEARLMLTGAGQVVTDRHATLFAEAVEAVGEAQLPASDPDPGWASYQGLPVLPAAPEFSIQVSWGFERPGDTEALHLDPITTAYGTRARGTFALPFRSTTRAEAWDLIRFFEDRRGMLRPFWAASPLTEYTLGSIDPGDAETEATVSVVAAGELVDWTDRPYLGMELVDGTVKILEVASVARDGGLDVLSLADAEPGLPAASAVARLFQAHRVRFGTDELEEAWTTDAVMEAQLPLVELPEDKSVVLADLTEVATVPLDTVYDIAACKGNTLGGDAEPPPAPCGPIEDVDGVPHLDGVALSTSYSVAYTMEEYVSPGCTDFVGEFSDTKTVEWDSSGAWVSADFQLSMALVNEDGLCSWKLSLPHPGTTYKTTGSTPVGSYPGTCPDPSGYKMIAEVS